MPKGDRASFARRKCIFPHGMPMMVIISINPAMKYSMAVCRPPKINQIILPKNFIPCLNDYCRSTGGYHEHGAVGTNGLIVDVDAYDGVGSKSLSTLHHLLHGGVLGF